MNYLAVIFVIERRRSAFTMSRQMCFIVCYLNSAVTLQMIKVFLRKSKHLWFVFTENVNTTAWKFREWFLAIHDPLAKSRTYRQSPPPRPYKEVGVRKGLLVMEPPTPPPPPPPQQDIVICRERRHYGVIFIFSASSILALSFESAAQS